MKYVRPLGPALLPAFDPEQWYTGRNKVRSYPGETSENKSLYQETVQLYENVISTDSYKTGFVWKRWHWEKEFEKSGGFENLALSEWN